MHQTKSKRSARYRLMLAAILLLACAALTVTATWARYRADEFGYLEYAVKAPGSISLSPETGGWVFYEDSAFLAFSVGSDGADDRSVSIRLLASLSIAELDGEAVRLSVSDAAGTTTCTAVAVPIEEGTALYKTFGAGRVYIFRDPDGNELSWTLEGGTDSGLSAQLEITGLSKPDNPALLQLQVVGG